jgi:hypothetical protein
MSTAVSEAAGILAGKVFEIEKSYARAAGECPQFTASWP